MVSQRPNTIIVLVFLVWDGMKLLWESFYKGIYALIVGKIIPLKTSRFIKIWHWGAASGPKKFWHFPTSIQIGRLVSTLIQVIFYPKK
jgi:hypothetical protein